MNQKQSFVCNICKKIQNKPVYLPCLCNSVCQQHIDDLIEIQKKIEQKESIQCEEFHVFEVEADAFAPNTHLAKLIDKEDYLTEEEKHQKLDLVKNSLNILNSFERFKIDHDQCKITRFDHFQELRRKINLRRDELIKEITDGCKVLVEKLKETKSDLDELFIHSFQSRNLNYIIENESKYISDMFRCVPLDSNRIQEKANEQAKVLEDLNDESTRLEYYNDLINFIQFDQLEFKDFKISDNLFQSVFLNDQMLLIKGIRHYERDFLLRLKIKKSSSIFPDVLTSYMDILRYQQEDSINSTSTNSDSLRNSKPIKGNMINKIKEVRQITNTGHDMLLGPDGGQGFAWNKPKPASDEKKLYQIMVNPKAENKNIFDKIEVRYIYLF